MRTQLFLCASNYTSCECARNYTSCECKLLVRPCRLRGYLWIVRQDRDLIWLQLPYAVCDNCKVTQKATSCSVKWTLKIHIQNSKQPLQKLQLQVYQEAVSKLFSICHLIANETTEEEITEAVLNLDTVKVCFDTQTRKLVDIEKIAI